MPSYLLHCIYIYDTEFKAIIDMNLFKFQDLKKDIIPETTQSAIILCERIVNIFKLF